MNKADLVNKVSAQTGETKTVVSSVVDTLIETIVDLVLLSQEIVLQGRA